MKKVFVVTKSWSYDYEHGIECLDVYQTLSQAREAVFFDAECWRDDNEFPHQTEDISDYSIEIYEEGDYSNNHVSWNIFEKEIVKD